MKKRPYFQTAAKVVAAYDNDPSLTSVQYGEKLGLHPAYIRKALQRNDRKLALAKPRERA